MARSAWAPAACLRSTHGHTLIELMVVLGISAIVASLAVPRALSWREGTECRAVAKRILHCLRDARSRSLAKNREHRVEFQTEEQRFGIREGDRALNTQWKSVPPVRIWEVCPRSVVIESNVHSIQFNTNGTANGGTIRVRDPARSRLHEIVVNRVGRIRVQ